MINRRARVWYPGAQYHVMNRGNRKAEIFRRDEDYEVYLRIMEKARKRYSFKLLGYCLMPNHVHLHIQTDQVELWKIIHYVHGNYAKYYNKVYSLVGHLFQGRYIAQIIENDAYCLAASRYIHLNPVKACIVDDPKLYPWSSFRYYINQKKPKWVELECDYVKGYFGKYGHEQYEAFVKGSIENMTSESLYNIELAEIDLLECEVE